MEDNNKRLKLEYYNKQYDRVWGEQLQQYDGLEKIDLINIITNMQLEINELKSSLDYQINKNNGGSKK